MSSKFFNNIETPLIEKFKGIAENMLDFHTFFYILVEFRLPILAAGIQSVMLDEVEFLDDGILNVAGGEEFHHLFGFFLNSVRLDVKTLVVGFIGKQHLGDGIGARTENHSSRTKMRTDQRGAYKRQRRRCYEYN